MKELEIRWCVGVSTTINQKDMDFPRHIELGSIPAVLAFGMWPEG
jgi:hypothetical protein